MIDLPLVLAGPDTVDALLPHRVDFLNQLYCPVVTILSAGFLNTLYHLSVPVRTIAVVLWLYMSVIAVLVGAALNAVVDRQWPHEARERLP
ncbi:hypothetical protein [Kribbella sp. NPDC051620]|uniref:hypothetical protein n=1 Tax=Kribbella sp. NPDC051620 TaxID=3364120 RepID=UPI00378F3480